MITEPATMITDYILALTSLYLLYQLRKISNNPPAPSWSAAFLFVVVASFTGGTTHGFVQYLSPIMYTILWKMTLVSIGLADFFLLVGTGRWSTRISTDKIFGFAGGKLIIYLIQIVQSDEFVYAALDYAFTLVIVIIIWIWHKKQIPKAAYMYLLLVLLLAVFIGMIWGLKIGLTNWFNHNDIAHILQIGIMIAMYKVTIIVVETDSA